MPLILTVKLGDWIQIDGARISVRHLRGLRCRVAINAPKESIIERLDEFGKPIPRKEKELAKSN